MKFLGFFNFSLKVAFLIGVSFFAFMGCTLDSRISSLSSSAAYKTISLTDQSATEGLVLNLPVELGTAAAETLKLEYQVVPGTALYGKEFDVQSGIVIVNQGQTSGTISFPILEDNIYEPQKYFYVDVNFSSLQEIHRYKINVVDNDVVPQISFQSATYNFAEKSENYSVTLILSHPSEFDVSVSASVAGDATGNGVDYTFASSNLSFPPMQTLLTKDFQVVDDLLTETDELAILTLANPIGGTLGAVNITTVSILDNEIKVTATAPNTGAQWMDYVQTLTGRHKLADVACSTGAFANAINCAHGGEARTVRVSDYNSCSNIKMVDALAAFDWKCFAEDNLVYFRSRLKDGKGLKDLVDATAWKNNKVQLINTQTMNVIRESASSAWWSNPISVLPLNVGMAAYALATSGSIYTVSDARTSYGYNITATKVGIVHLTGGSMTMSASTSTYCSGARANVCSVAMYSWLEGVFTGTGANQNIRVSSLGRVQNSTVTGGSIGIRSVGTYVFNSVIKNTSGNGIDSAGYSLYYKVSVMGAGGQGIYGGISEILLESTVANNTSTGINLSFSSVVVNSKAFNNGAIGVSITSGKIASTMAVSNTSVGFRTADSSRTLGLTSALNSSYGLQEVDDYPFHHNIVLVNNATGLISSSSGDTPIFSNIYAAHNTTGIDLPTSAGGSSTFLGNLYIGSNGDDCVVAGAGLGLDTNCDVNAASTAIKPSVVTTNLFYGKALSDSLNAHSLLIDGTGGILFSSITDWFTFNGPMRLFGKQGSAFPNADNRGRCTSGTCQLWDFGLPVSSDLKNKNGTLVNGDPCPSPAYEPVSDGGLPYLLNAYEIMLNEDGNEDGFCQASESCIFMPNLGAYQGSGDYTTNQCVFTSLTFPDVKMYGFPSN